MTLNIPTELSEITLIQFMTYNQYLNSNKDITVEQADKKLVAVMCKLTAKEVGNIPIKDYKEVVNLLRAVMEEGAKEMVPQWNGLGFIPSLEDVSVDEYADLENYYTEDESSIDKFVGVLYRPVVVKSLGNYSIEKYEGKIDHIDLIHQMPMNVVRAALGFFLTLRDDLLNCTLRYSSQQEK